MKNESKNEKFSSPDKHQSPSKRTETYLLTMLPAAKGNYVFSGDGEQEWEIQRYTDTKFAIYGMYNRNPMTQQLLITNNCVSRRKNNLENS